MRRGAKIDAIAHFELLLCIDDEDDDIELREQVDEVDEDELDVVELDDMLDELLAISYIEVIDEVDVNLCDDDEEVLDDVEVIDLENVVVNDMQQETDENEYTQI